MNKFNATMKVRCLMLRAGVNLMFTRQRRSLVFAAVEQYGKKTPNGPEAKAIVSGQFYCATLLCHFKRCFSF
jgi:hypothetical protein